MSIFLGAKTIVPPITRRLGSGLLCCILHHEALNKKAQERSSWAFERFLLLA